MKNKAQNLFERMAEIRISQLLQEIHDTSDDPQVISCTEAAMKRREERRKEQ